MGLSGSAHHPSQQTSVEELLAFIEGDEGEGGNGQGGGVNAVDLSGGGKSAGKKGKKKPKKPVSQMFKMHSWVGPVGDKYWFILFKEEGM